MHSFGVSNGVKVRIEERRTGLFKQMKRDCTYSNQVFAN
jgi:hypothetical protein